MFHHIECKECDLVVLSNASLKKHTHQFLILSIASLFAIGTAAALCGLAGSAAAALLFLSSRLFLAVRRLFAHKRALRLRAVGRTVALPVADGLFADRLAGRLRV